MIARLFLTVSLVLLQAVTSRAKHNWTENSQLIVHIPSNLYDPHGSMHYRIPFGSYPRAKTHSDFVYYIDNPLCFDFSPRNRSQFYDSGFPGKRPQGPHILMINGGGGCSAVKKVRRAQEMGASAVLIAEPHCTCWDVDCVSEFPEDTCDNEQTAVTNDGSADDITVPSFILFKSLREKLLGQLVKHAEPVLIELQWDLETDLDEGSMPSIHFWTSAYDEKTVSVDTYTDLQAVTTALAPYAKFEPRFVLFNGTDFGCHNGGANCGDMCTNAGRYCTVTAPESTGMARMKETLRRMCVFNHFTLQQYWKYVIYHKENCEGSKAGKEDDKCWEKGFKAAGIHDHGTIEECFRDTGGLDKDGVNDFLEQALRHIGHAGAMPYPALSVDRHPVSVSPASLYVVFATYD